MPSGKTSFTCSRPRWPIAILDGLFFGWFLLIAHFAAGSLMQISEWVWLPKSVELQAPITLWAQALVPEETWSLMTGCLTFAISFGLLSLTSDEAPTTRLFRWAVIAVFTLLVALSQPAMSAFKNLSGGPDGHTWDELLFVALALSALVYGIRRFRRMSTPALQSAPPPAPVTHD